MEETMAWWNNLFDRNSGFSQADKEAWANLQSLTVDPWAMGYTPSYGQSTTMAPVPTTMAPVPTTMAPVPTTMAPVPTTMEPAPTTTTTMEEEGVPTGWTVAPGDTDTRSIFDNPNVLNASITSTLYGLAAFAEAWSSKSFYNYYEQQEQVYLENAKIQADRLKTAGAIEAANIRAKHAITQGQNELAVVGAGAGSISGSFADYLTANRKNDMRDEYAQDLSTLYAVSNAKRQGLTQAFNTAGQAYAQAIKQRNKSISRIFIGLAEGVGSILADIRAKRQADYTNESARESQEDTYERKMRYYGNAKTGEPIYAAKTAGINAFDPDSGNKITGSADSIEDAIRIETGQQTWPYDIIKPTDERGI